MKSRFLRQISLTLAVLVLVETLLPSVALALTSGPSQPEFSGFQQVGTSEMVDLFSGDFSYNIPLCEIGGYPLNIAYNSDPRMDDEASWVGLGWTLNPGSINRQMRGLPDDFKGDTVTKEFNITEDRTIGGSLGVGFEFFGKEFKEKSSVEKQEASKMGKFPKLEFRLGLMHNTRRGFEITTGLNFVSAVAVNKANTKFSGNLGLSFVPSEGLKVNPTLGLSFDLGKKVTIQNNLSAGFNSRTGLRDLTFHSNGNFQGKKRLWSLHNGSVGFDFGSYSYTPISLLPFINSSFIFHGTLGAEVYGSHPNFLIDGFYNSQKLHTNEESQIAYGYLHLKKGIGNASALIDYNSEINGPYKEDAPNLPLAYGTPDIFSIYGNGVGGQFKATRNDVGIFRPAFESNRSGGGSLGIELGAGGFAKGGLNISVSQGETEKEGWNADENELADNFTFTENGEDGGVYEAVYFKNSGEKSLLYEGPSDKFTKLGGTSPVAIDIDKPGEFSTNLLATGDLKKQDLEEEETLSPTSKIQDLQRLKRNQTISYLTVEEAEQAGLDKRSSTRPKHHLSEVTVTQSNGSRYVYGQPVYNNKQRDVTFSVDNVVKPEINQPTNILFGTNNIESPDYGLVQYQPYVDDSKDNVRGREHYFDATEIPAYAHSFLLTGVLSSDYVDRTGNGITDDDTGNAVKFNYTKHQDAYRWRIPIQENKAKYHEGLKSSMKDDKGSYVFGEKEIWYPESIESRLKVAKFHTSFRLDGRGVKSKDGGIEVDAEQLLEKLDSIQIFSKNDLEQNVADPIPIKTIHFRYSYELCGSIPNRFSAPGDASSSYAGKLTLDKIFFTYGYNKSGKLNAYHFDYNGKSDEKYNYNLGYYDRWGSFKKNPDTFPANHDYPYVLQEKALTDEWAGVWNLSQITLPSGSKIEVTYESDDYAYVQNKRAGQMMEIVGFAISGGAAYNQNIYTEGKEGIFGVKKIVNKKYVVVKLPKAVEDIEEAKLRYLEGIDHIYFDCFVQLEEGENKPNERVKGYFQIDEIENELEVRNGDLLYIPVKFLNTNRGKKVHPITFAALLLLKLELPEVIFPGYQTDEFGQVLKSFAGLVRQVGFLTKGFENNLMKKGYGKSIYNKQGQTEKKSWLRLCSPTFKKLGGGSRVSKLLIKDEWNFTNGGGSAEYGQTYNYEIPMRINGNYEQISSGVAIYEPGIGGEENMMKTPLPYKEKYLLAPKNEFYGETPIGESLFPSPSVGYSQVQVEDIANLETELKRNKTGWTINNFYTAKDFPTLVQTTDIISKQARNNPIFRILGIKSSDKRAFSQGFTIELNDMHGKPRGQSIYDKNGSLLSATTYNYKVKDPDAAEKQLSNEVLVAGTDGELETVQLGLCMDTWAEMFEENSNIRTNGAAPNLDLIAAGIFPFPFFLSFLIGHKEQTQFRAATTTKLVQRCGILDNVVVMENGSTLTTSNELFDKETGEVLLTKTQNEFDDNIYNFSYPAHWAYEGMGQAYKNIGSEHLFSESFADGKIPSRLEPYFYQGDELLVKNPDLVYSGRYFVEKQEDFFRISKENGAYVSRDIIEGNTVKIIRSGRRNMPSVPIGQITSRENPIFDSNLRFDQSKKILNTSVQTFKEDWKVNCSVSQLDNCGEESFTLNWKVNPYVQGVLGNWRPHESFAYHDQRLPNQLTVSSSMRIRNTGITADFEPFWTYPASGSSWEAPAVPASKWVSANTMEIYDFRGNELQNKDALGIHSAALFGYKQILPIAVANNAENNEIVYDGFEEKNCQYRIKNIFNTPEDLKFGRQVCLGCIEDRSGFLTESIAHTGKRALKIAADDLMNIEGAYKVTKKIDFNCDTEPEQPEGDPEDYIPDFCSDCIPPFSLNKNEDYNISIWVATDNSLACGAPPLGYEFRLDFLDENKEPIDDSAITLLPSGPVIEGWQQIDGKVVVPSDAVYLTFDFGLINGLMPADPIAYFDDFRFHPWLSNMKSYVYDPFSERLMATLDENNYASFYEYNDEGLLIRTKRETEKGIVTIQEGRTILNPNNSQ